MASPAAVPSSSKLALAYGSAVISLTAKKNQS